MKSKQPQKKPQPQAYAGELKPCPICGKPSTVEAHPFCSKRCSDVDLHRWLGGTYAVPAVEVDESVDDEDDQSL